jgi:hypothetical protein
LFGLEMADDAGSGPAVPAAPKPSRPSKTVERSKATKRLKPSAAKMSKPPRSKPVAAEPGRAGKRSLQ